MTENSEAGCSRWISIIIDDDKNTKLHYSAASGHLEDVLQDLETEHKIDVENYLGWTPLMIACKHGYLDIAKLLLEHRADATKKNKFGMSVFLISITSGNVELVHLLLQHLLCGGVSRQSMQNLFSPLSLSILFCHQHILKYLVEQNFNINASTPYTGITPLMFASAMENCKAFTLLLSKGVDITIKNCIGITAHEITQSRKRKVDMNKLVEANQQAPILMKSSHQHLQPQQHQLPYIVISPQPTYFQMSPNPMMNPHIRKSSNTMSPSPNFYFTAPNVTPITPMNYLSQPQMFFPPEFSPSQIYTTSPISNMYNNSNDFLNARMNPSSMFMSPLPQTMNYPSPCV